MAKKSDGNKSRKTTKTEEVVRKYSGSSHKSKSKEKPNGGTDHTGPRREEK